MSGLTSELNGENKNVRNIFSGLRLQTIANSLVEFAMAISLIILILVVFQSIPERNINLLLGMSLVAFSASNILTGIAGFRFLSAPHASNAGKYALLLTITSLLQFVVCLPLLGAKLLPSLWSYIGVFLSIFLLLFNSYFISCFIKNISEYMQSSKSAMLSNKSIYYWKFSIAIGIIIVSMVIVIEFLAKRIDNFSIEWPGLLFYILIGLVLLWLMSVLLIFRNLNMARKELLLFIKKHLFI